MTISEIAKTHGGRTFRRTSSSTEVYCFDDLHQLSLYSQSTYKAGMDAYEAINCTFLTADDWEFVPEMMGFVEAVRKLKSAAEHGIKGATQIRRVEFKWAVKRQKDSHTSLFLITAEGQYGGNYEPSVDEVSATDWIVEEAK